MEKLKTILSELVGFPSVTPEDAGCQEYMIGKLEALGFTCQRFDNAPASNFFARIGTKEPLLIFAGHTDVVPVGDENKWVTSPFSLHQKGDLLFGRGVADMKGSLACMLLMAERFVEIQKEFKGSLGFLITSAEEGEDFDKGTPYVMAKIHELQIHPSYCIVGEPSSSHHVGDVIKVGRRGSLTGVLSLHGKQGHVAYPQLAINPIHAIAPALLELTNTVWDEGNTFFPPTSFQITSIHSDGGADNIIPGDVLAHFNFRFSTEQTEDTLKHGVLNIFGKYNLQPNITWRLNGNPFLTSQGNLITQCKNSIFTHTGKLPECTTNGGTSDGRFIAPYGVEVIELGPVNATIHQVNECVSLSDLVMLATIYLDIATALLV